MTDPVKYLDLKKAIDESDSRFLKNLPGFVVNILRRIIHEEEINNILNSHKDKQGVDFHNAILSYLNLKINIRGLENLPEQGRCFFIANHPFGVVDGLILTKIVLDKYGDFRGIGNEAFKYIPNLAPYIAVVNAYGTTSRSRIEDLEKIFASDLPVTHFPAGEVSRRYHRQIRDKQWRKSVVTRSIVHERDIVPVFFEGSNSGIFQNIYLIRSLIGVKLNLELSLLPHEFFNKKHQTVNVAIGRPVSWKKFDNRCTHQHWTNKLQDYVYSLKENPMSEFAEEV